MYLEIPSPPRFFAKVAAGTSKDVIKFLVPPTSLCRQRVILMQIILMKLFSLFIVFLGASANLTDKSQCSTECVEDGSVDYFPDKVNFIVPQSMSTRESFQLLFSHPFFTLGLLRSLHVFENGVFQHV